MDSQDFFEQMKKEREFYKKHYIRGFFRDTYHFIIWGIPRRFKDLCNSLQWAWQRVFRGYDDRAYWALDACITDIALPVLKQYREGCHGYPVIEEMEGKTWEEQKEIWNSMLDKMILAFQTIRDDDMDCEVHDEAYYHEQHRKIQEGLLLFGKHLRSLWD